MADNFLMLNNYETVIIGSTPANESCAQVGTNDYGVRAQAECRAYRAQLYRFLEQHGYPRAKLPDSFKIRVLRHQHDFGDYYEVAVQFQEEDPATRVCYSLLALIENEGPAEWDDEAKAALLVYP